MGVLQWMLEINCKSPMRNPWEVDTQWSETVLGDRTCLALKQHIQGLQLALLDTGVDHKN
jgi:hypothetical protein